MRGDRWYWVAQDRIKHQRRAVEEGRRAGRAAREGDSLQKRIRARVARSLFALAVAVERRETWRVVWERLGERGRL